MSPNWLLNTLLFTANAGWALGTWQTGNKRRWSFIVGIGVEVIWAAYAVLAHVLWGLIPWCIVGVVVYVRNFVKWKDRETNAVSQRPGEA